MTMAQWSLKSLIKVPKFSPQNVVSTNTSFTRFKILRDTKK